ncbi:MAG: hypothetical protein DWH91_00625 [Planctomycetota bacterium]|nr:MAG: hypothetical protein DWH91_00625 [Planctomycetota bacterium]
MVYEGLRVRELVKHGVAPDIAGDVWVAEQQEAREGCVDLKLAGIIGSIPIPLDGVCNAIRLHLLLLRHPDIPSDV